MLFKQVYSTVLKSNDAIKKVIVGINVKINNDIYSTGILILTTGL